MALVRDRGLGGLAPEFGVATRAEVALLVIRLSKKVGTLLDRGTVLFLLKALAATATMFGVLWIARPLYENQRDLATPTLLLQVGATVLLGGATYIAASVLLRQEEVATLLRLARR